jgi:hypothetical protein
MDMHHGHVHAARSLTCRMDVYMDIQYDIEMQHVHINMQHGQRHEA